MGNLPKPRKSLGQHFLRDEMIIDRIIQALSIQPNDHLVEIGPGRGALTAPLLRQLEKSTDETFTLDAVEFDHGLVNYLLENYSHPHFMLHEGDATTFNFAILKNDARKLRVFGNLPYNVSTPLIFHLLSFSPLITDMLFMLQKEVAERIAASPGEKAYGRLSVMVQYHCAVSVLFDVPQAAFTPPPAVTSSIIKLMPYKQKPVTADQFNHFAGLVKTAFNQRRKTLSNSLKSYVSKEVFQRATIDPQRRPETLSIAEFVALSNLSTVFPIKPEKQR